MSGNAEMKTFGPGPLWNKAENLVDEDKDAIIKRYEDKSYQFACRQFNNSNQHEKSCPVYRLEEEHRDHEKPEMKLDYGGRHNHHKTSRHQRANKCQCNLLNLKHLLKMNDRLEKNDQTKIRFSYDKGASPKMFGKKNFREADAPRSKRKETKVLLGRSYRGSKRRGHLASPLYPAISPYSPLSYGTHPIADPYGPLSLGGYSLTDPYGAFDYGGYPMADPYVALSLSDYPMTDPYRPLSLEGYPMTNPY